MIWIAALGASVRRFLERLGDLARLAFLAFRGLLGVKPHQWRAVGPVIKAQVRFTGLEALGLVCVFAALLGAITLLQAYAQLEGFGPARFTGTLLVAVIVRELGPLLASVVVIGRSATAIAAELASMRLNSELEGLEVHGVDPMQYVVLPRLLGGMASVLVLMAFLDFSALAGGFLVAHLRVGLPFALFREQVQASLELRDVLVTCLKGPLFGGIIALVACYAGLRVRQGPTEIPQAATRAVVGSLTAVFLADGFLVAWLYA